MTIFEVPRGLTYNSIIKPDKPGNGDIFEDNEVLMSDDVVIPV